MFRKSSYGVFETMNESSVRFFKLCFFQSRFPVRLQASVKLGFVADPIGTFLTHAVGLDKDEPLRGGVFDPENEVGVKAFVLKETNAFAATQISQKEYLRIGQRLRLFLFKVIAQVSHELFFTLVQPARSGPHLIATLDQQWLIQMPIKMNVWKVVRLLLVDTFTLFDQGLDALDSDRGTRTR